MIIFNKISKHPVARNSAALAIVQIANYFVPLMVLPYLTRVLGIATFGVVAIVFASIQLAYVLTDYGFSLSATYIIARERDNYLKVSELIGSVFGAKVFLVGFACAGLLIFPYFTQYRDNQLLFAVGVIAVVAQAFQPIWFFQGIQRLKNVTYYMVTTKLSYALLVFLFVEDQDDAVWVIFGWGLAQTLGALIAISQVYKEGYCICFPTLNRLLAVLRDGAQFFWSRIAVALFTSASTIIVGAVGGAVQAAQFSVCEQIYKAGQSATSPINQAMYPYMAQERNWALFTKLIVVVVGVLALGCFVIGLFADDLLSLLFGSEFKAAAPVLLVFLCLTVVNYISVSFGYPAFAALGRVNIANLTVIVGSVVHLCFIWFLYYENMISAMSVALAIIATEMLIMIMRVAAIKYYMKFDSRITSNDRN